MFGGGGPIQRGLSRSRGGCHGCKASGDAGHSDGTAHPSFCSCPETPTSINSKCLLPRSTRSSRPPPHDPSHPTRKRNKYRQPIGTHLPRQVAHCIASHCILKEPVILRGITRALFHKGIKGHDSGRRTFSMRQVSCCIGFLEVCGFVHLEEVVDDGVYVSALANKCVKDLCPDEGSAVQGL